MTCLVRSARCSVLVLCFVLVLVLGAACGSKGDPLPPLRLAPAKAEGLSAVRIEGRPIALSFVVPAANDDGSVPVDIASMRVFAVTMPAGNRAPTAQDLLGGDLVVATIDVPEPGATIVWEDTTVTGETSAAPRVRYYAVAGLSRGNRVGVGSDVVAVPLAPIEGAPSNLSASFTETAIKLDWLGVAEGARYRVYEVTADAPGVALTPAPVTGTTFEVPLAAPGAEVSAAFGVERCFSVRAARASARASVESAAAGPVCVTPRDVFPPAAPANLTAVASAGALNLIWDAVDAPDLAGYLVLRGDAPGETLTPPDELRPLFATPITDTTYRDTTAEAGRRYVYAVVAVDTASPPNRSAESNRVEETGRD